LACFVKFALIEYTKEEALEEIRKIINDANWTDNIDEELGRGIKAFMEKNKITDEEVKELIKNNKTFKEQKKYLVLEIFKENVFSQVKEELPKQ
jgi:GTPase Era involved in 16S rRNA processing